MAILAQDTFVHPNQANWPTSSGGQTWTAPRGGGTYSISGNEGVNTANGGTLSIARIGSGTATSTEVLVRVSPADTTSNIGCVARYVGNNDFYYAVLSGHPTIGKDVASTFTTLGTDNTFSYSAGTFYWMRFNLVSTTLKLRVWQSGNSEPGSWNITITGESSISSGGYGLTSDATGSTSFDSLTVTDAATAVHFLICDGMGGVFS